MLVITLIVTAAILLVALSYFQLQFRHMGEKCVAAVAEKSKGLIAEDPYRAEAMIYRSLRLNGWDYRDYLAQQKSNKAFMIGQAVPKIVMLTRALRLTPTKNFPWILPLFVNLGKIYITQGKYSKAMRLYEHTLDFIGGYGEDIPYAQRSDFIARIHARQALLEMKKRNYRSAVKYHLTAYAEKLAALKGAGKEAEFDKLFPFKGDSFLKDNLAAMSQADNMKIIVEIVNKTVRNSQGRINAELLNRDLDNFFINANKTEEADYEAAKDIIQKALTRFDKQGAE